MSDIIPWTDRQFANAMRRANWKNNGQGCYIHNATGAKFMAWTWTQRREDKFGNGKAWYEFALIRKTPTEAPF